MKLSTTLKTLTMLGLTTLSLAATSSQANSGFVSFGGNANPWMTNPAMQQARYQAEMKQRHAQLDQRQDAQMQRILKGMDNGKLTTQEAAGLLREHLAIANMERGYLADGRLGPNELSNLEKRLEVAEKNIKWEIRDRERVASSRDDDHLRKPGEYGQYNDRDYRRDDGRPGDNGRR